jgi:glycerol-3-phosphate acyltransferase PlsX
LRDALARAGASDVANLTIADAPEGVSMDESPIAALRQKPRASIRVACALAASGGAAGVYSAGHTGASLVAAHGAWGLATGVERPALAVVVPTRDGNSVLLDAGANADCRPSHLAQFGVMGAAYATLLWRMSAPRVGLLSIGEEAGKGNELTREAHGALAAMPINFVGNIDAARWFDGLADVVVTDGFTGNIALKVGEAVAEIMAATLPAGVATDASERFDHAPTGLPAEASERSDHAPTGLPAEAWERSDHAPTGLPAEAWERFSHAKAGGAPLLGVNGLIVVGHGRSTPQAIANGIALASRLAEYGIVSQVAEAVGRVLK